jgi:hypothetical protein
MAVSAARAINSPIPPGGCTPPRTRSFLGEAGTEPERPDTVAYNWSKGAASNRRARQEFQRLPAARRPVPPYTAL